jgi:hypothetical protein
MLQVGDPNAEYVHDNHAFQAVGVVTPELQLGQFWAWGSHSSGSLVKESLPASLNI